MRIELLITALAGTLFFSCSPARIMERDLLGDSIGENHFTGVVVYDLDKKKELLNINGEKYFTPASNVKLFTFYSAWKTLKDSVVAFEIAERNDSLILRGSGDPGFLADSTSLGLLQRLHDGEKKLYLEDIALSDEPYGPGWSWDDYQYAYMPEKSVFPVYGNTLTLHVKGDSLVVEPEFFRNKVQSVQKAHYRDQDSNEFYVNKSLGQEGREIPFKTSNQLVADLLGDALKKKVTLISAARDRSYRKVYRVPYDSLFTKMLVDSDNFIAEQLMLQVGFHGQGTYSVPKAIAYSQEHYLRAIPQKPRWVDGSGLSRYNLFSPLSIVYLLSVMHTEMPEEKLLGYLPIGGVSGTLKNDHYEGQSYVYAKSGTLSNNYCLSGYLKTKKGRTLAFSYMTNHYQGSSANRKREIAAFLERLHNAY